jgi:cation diffusion facilitator family transporter
MSGNNNSVRAVFFALGSNLLITILKFIVSTVTLSAGMLAESIHSLADCGNQVFLLVGNKRAAKKANDLHPFGYGKEEYFWGFLVAVLLFFVGAVFSIYEGIHKIFLPTEIQNVTWSLVVLIISIIIEGKSFWVAYSSFRKTHEATSMYKALKDSTDTSLLVILLEDSAALVGLTIVLCSTLLAWYLHPVFDAIGSILVGLLLVGVSLFMTNELRKLIVGENVSKAMRDELSRIIEANSVVHTVNYISAMMMGKSKFLLVVGVDLVDTAEASEIEIEMQRMRKELLHKNSFIHSIFFDVRDLEREGLSNGVGQN